MIILLFIIIVLQFGQIIYNQQINSKLNKILKGFSSAENSPLVHTKPSSTIYSETKFNVTTTNDSSPLIDKKQESATTPSVYNDTPSLSIKALLEKCKDDNISIETYKALLKKQAERKN